ncbi:unnamed protein product [Rotaria magnacalcarata]|uniref:Uncharacterized protein n=1 Tax=Rotaria magnacalcarata TaxID=392030 RepID=A0A815SMS3_9BILA|nr:unnamed protein product [Rotaria magnacalcarata]
MRDVGTDYKETNTSVTNTSIKSKRGSSLSSITSEREHEPSLSSSSSSSIVQMEVLMVVNKKFLKMIQVKIKLYNVVIRMNSFNGLIMKIIALDGYVTFVESSSA